jgi:hypothetical protein
MPNVTMVEIDKKRVSVFLVLWTTNRYNLFEKDFVFVIPAIRGWKIIFKIPLMVIKWFF